MLYPFQEKMIEEIINSFRKGNTRILIQAPTGSGKSYVIKHLVSISKKKTAIFTHRKELKAMFGENVHMIETFKRRNFDYPELMIIDECHLTIFDSVIKSAPKDTVILGFSATPIRTGKQTSLHELYQDIIYAPNAEALIEQGLLVPTINYSHESVDWSKAKKTAGDYDLSYQVDMFHKNRVYEGVAKNYRRLCDGTKAIAFTPDINSSRMLCEHLEKEGLNAKSVDSTLDKKTRQETIDWFIQSKNGILVNCSLLTTGFDCPDIETVILYRATTSRALYNQMVGRGVRISEGKKACTVLDFGENIKRFGFWEDDYEYKLEKKVSKNESLAPIRLCPKCERMNRIQDKNCKYCDFMFPVHITKTEEAELKLFVKKPKIGFYLHQAKTLAEAKEIIKEYGYKPGWWHMNKHRYPHII